MKKKETSTIEQVLRSMQGSRRAQPEPELLDRIEARISDLADREITIRWPRVAIAALLIIGLNVIGFVQVIQSNARSKAGVNTTVAGEQLVSDYNFYE